MIISSYDYLANISTIIGHVTWLLKSLKTLELAPSRVLKITYYGAQGRTKGGKISRTNVESVGCAFKST